MKVAGTGLLWVRNTEADVFRLGRAGPVYFLVAGRWFSAPGFNGPWTFATTDAARRLRQDSARARAIARARVGAGDGAGGRSGAARAGAADGPRQQDDGAGARRGLCRATPEFQPIAPTTVARATNTDKDILKVGDLYYMCFQGVWFVARAATGPWEVTGSVPPADLRDPGQLSVAPRDLRHGRG